MVDGESGPEITGTDTPGGGVGREPPDGSRDAHDSSPNAHDDSPNAHDSSPNAPDSRRGDTSRDGIITVRGALVGIGWIWLTAVSAFAVVGAVNYGVRTSPAYLLVAALAAALAVAAGSASLRTFGYR